MNNINGESRSAQGTCAEMGIKMKETENDILETTLSIAEKGYPEAYRFLLDEYERNVEKFGPQTLYFLACLAGGADMPEQALGWMRKAILDNGWWYRPEVLEDDEDCLPMARRLYKVSFWYGTHREWAGVLEMGITELPEIL